MSSRRIGKKLWLYWRADGSCQLLNRELWACDTAGISSEIPRNKHFIHLNQITRMS
jgi:hypothetical protein